MSPRLLATLVAAAAIAATAMFLMVPRGHAGRTVVAVFPSAPSLREGAAVTYLGVEAGRVTGIDLASGRVVVSLVVSRPDVVLHAGDSVRLRTLGLLGDRVVDIVPQRRPGLPPLGERDTLFGAAPPEPREGWPAGGLDSIVRAAGGAAIRDTAGHASPTAAAGAARATKTP